MFMRLFLIASLGLGACGGAQPPAHVPSIGLGEDPNDPEVLAVLSGLRHHWRTKRDLTQRGRANSSRNEGDPASEKFFYCCVAAEIGCAEEMCDFPPKDPNPVDVSCLMMHFKEYIRCYTGGHNNDECCRRAGVAAYGEQCLDFCHADDQTPLHKYWPCADAKPLIAKCNHDNYLL